MQPLTLIFLSLAGFLGGLIDSAAGGGGLITLPALLACGVPAQAALGTNKFQSSFGTACALANFWRKSKIIWKIALAGIPFSLAASVAGTKLALMIPQTILAKVLVVILPPSAILMFVSRRLVRFKDPDVEHGMRFWLITIVVCSIIGLYDGFFGPGTGTFLIVALVLFSKIPIVNATATAKTFNLASNIGSLVTFIFAGSVYYGIAIMMAIANIAGNYIGSHYAMKLGANFIQKIVYVSLAILFVYLVWKWRRA